MQGNASNSARVAAICAAVLLIFALWLIAPGQSNVGIAFFYAIPVGLATWWFGRRAGTIAVLGCSVLFCIGALIEPVDQFGLALGVRMLALIGVAALVALLHERQLVLEHSAEELEAIRAALTPAALPQLPGVDSAAAFVPSELGVSGDFYLLTNGRDGSAIAIVGDVVGHGPSAAQLATFVRARFAAFAAGTSEPAELLTLANAALFERPAAERELVSAVCLRLHDKQLSWAIAGHPPPLRLPGLDQLALEGSTYLLGAEAELALRNGETALPSGDGVLIYTDGATDVRQAGELLGLEGLSRLLAPLTKLPATEIVSQVERAILAWAEKPIQDDLCLLVLKSR
ncbi:MAG TPA: PP2C family protein-serine/threonine phosphatase [Solirubrobacterales bacterium]|nr:PP2C family protein-serine/threonine phosphatase [Solirubrobacterales bacterium]